MLGDPRGRALEELATHVATHGYLEPDRGLALH